MQRLYYVSHKNQDLGPFTREDILQQMKMSKLSPTDYVYIEEKEDWITLLEFSKQKEVTPPPIAKNKKDEAIPYVNLETQMYGSASNEPKEVRLSTTHLQNLREASFESTKVKIEKVEKSEKPEKSEKTDSHSLQFLSGEGHVTVRAQKAETMTLKLKGSKNLEVSGNTKVTFKAGAPETVSVIAPKTSQVGIPVKLSFEAIDKFGNLSTGYNGSLIMKSNPEIDGLGTVQFKDGRATKEVKTTRAGSVKIEVVPTGADKLRVYAEIKFIAAAASRLHIEAPSEAKVGEAVNVMIKALDQFGNVDTQFNDTVSMTLEGSTSQTFEVEFRSGIGHAKVM